MKTRAFCLALFLSVLATGGASNEVKDALSQEIIVLSGVEELVRSAKEASVKQAKDAVTQMINQVKSGFPDLPKESSDAIQIAALKMVKSVENSWSPDEAINVWKTEYMSDFTEDELRSLLASLKTPLGQKQIAAGKKAGTVLQKFLIERGKRALDEAMKEYISDLQKIVARKVK